MMNHRTKAAGRLAGGLTGGLMGFCLSALLGAALLLFSCEEPVPLHGGWADNLGNEVSFASNGTFTAFIASTLSPGTEIVYKGSYSVLLNVLTFQCSDPEPLRIVSEWDIRGNMLYLDWITDGGNPVRLTLYKVSN
ncbi:MAG: hypothetical protein LBQ55_04940 [Treponema sp.]|jgi:hypothetical protein|nr:hypothetical protein [Treponema sp.]